MTSDPPRLRLGIIGVVTVALFAALFARLYYLQVLASPELKLAAESNRVRVVAQPAPRGRLLDRHGRVLVDNRRMVVVTVDRDVLGDLGQGGRADLLARLSRVLGKPVHALESALADQRVSPYTPVPLAEDVAPETFVYLKEHAADFPGVDVEEVTVRTYPNGPAAAHLLGYVGEINEQELEERRQEGYRLGDQVGKAGAELAYEADLRGQPGLRKLEVDSQGQVLGLVAEQPPVQGHDVRLTIDLDIQRLAEDALRQGLERARSRRFVDDGTAFKAPAGAVVALEVDTGRVLALASYPTYDPGAFVNGISSAEFAALTDPANGTPFNNWAIQGEYAPGSTFKLVTAVAALQEGLITPSTRITDNGVYRIPDCAGKCTFRNAGGARFGQVDVARALAVSSDVFFYSLGHDFYERQDQYGSRPVQDAAEQLGFGSRTGIPLPAERPGRVPDPEFRRRLHEQRPDAFPESRWYPGDNVNLAIGQGETLVTPLQLANAYAAFANGGHVMQPAIASEVLSRHGHVVRSIEPVAARAVDLPPAVHHPVLLGLEGAVSDERGTAANAFAGFPLEQWPVAGKTGTAQVGGKQDTALFAAFGPVPDPRYAVAVVMEQAGFGATAAAPVARTVLGALSGVEEPVPVTPVSGGPG